MYRILYMLTIFIIVSGHWEHHHRRHCPWKTRHAGKFCGHRHIETDLDDLKNDFIAAEIKLQRLCNQNSGIVTKEIYDDNAYSLIYVLKENDNYNITVNIFHRFIQTKVTDNATLIIEDLKVIPGMVRPEEATWTFVKGNLEIRFPYTVPIGKEIIAGCGAISAGVLNVPQAIGIEPRINLDLTDNEITDKYNKIVFSDVKSSERLVLGQK